MSRSDPPETPTPIKLTNITVDDAAKLLSVAYSRRITPEDVRQVVEDAGIENTDGTFSLIDYVAFLAAEVGSDRSTRND